jgi:predicted nuclease with TOPRIM domain
MSVRKNHYSLSSNPEERSSHVHRGGSLKSRNIIYVVNIVKNHASTQTNMNSIIKTAAKITEELSQLNDKSDAKQDGIQHTKARLGEFLKNMEKQSKAWTVHYKYRQLVSEEDTFFWISMGDLKAETESEIVAVQDQALQTKYYATKH